VPDASTTLAKAETVELALDHFLDSCEEWLEIKGCPCDLGTGFERRSATFEIQVFEAIPEVYPHAMELLSALGPGQRRELNWLDPLCSPKLQAALGSVALHVRQLIVQTWGWEHGRKVDDLRALVEERRRTGMPTTQRHLAETMNKVYALFPADRHWELEAPIPPFKGVVPEAKREQFDHIVTLEAGGIDFVEELLRCYPELASSFLDGYRERAFEYIDNVDAYERAIKEESNKKPKWDLNYRDLAWEKENYEYQYKPLIGKKAANIDWSVYTDLLDSQENLEDAIDSMYPPELKPKSEPIDPSETVRPDAPVEVVPDRVTLDQAASMVHRVKRTLEHYKTNGKLPAPAVEGNYGQAHLWDWDVMRPWLEATFNTKLPVRSPGSHK
jgi:hypothetical protein